MSEDKSKKIEKYPVEFPSRDNRSKNSPIVDVAENEIFPLGLERKDRSLGAFHSAAEVIATDIESDTEEQTIRGRQM